MESHTEQTFQVYSLVDWIYCMAWRWPFKMLKHVATSSNNSVVFDWNLLVFVSSSEWTQRDNHTNILTSRCLVCVGNVFTATNPFYFQWDGTCNHCSCGKAISITYSECAITALGVQHEMPCAILPSVAVRLYNIFRLCIINGMRFEKKLLNTKWLNDFLYNFSLKHFSL
jgi:hypothetical protein